MSKPTLPHASYRVYSKRGKSDCAIAAMATIFRRDPEEVLLAAAKVSPRVWESGLYCTDMVKVARRLKIKAVWRYAGQFSPEDDIGVLAIGYNDNRNEHCVALIEGWVLDPEQNPVSLWEYDEFCRVENAYGNALLQVIEP